MFLKFMLAQLISACQVVLLYNGFEAHLFYCGQVYSRSMGFYFEDLPKQREKRYCPVWALIDMDYRSEQPPISGTSNIVPIQASPQGSVLWKSWKKQYRAALFGMPLWSMEELIEGYVYDLFSLYAIDPSHVVQ